VPQDLPNIALAGQHDLPWLSASSAAVETVIPSDQAHSGRVFNASDGITATSEPDFKIAGSAKHI
jgi:hypothetical protein